ncbi:hypothetical protein V6N13_114896 [Hibiscus sabdariffa]|uniref:Uncharacterized protein n=1 Tax=Hibiscus sabdariffa TaxID=183260 RepID=A0ABR2U3W1_9ROSI
MNKSSSPLHRTKTLKQDNRNLRYSSKLCRYLLAMCITLLVLTTMAKLDLQIQSLSLSLSPKLHHHQRPRIHIPKASRFRHVSPVEKDLRFAFANQALDGHSWFMSSMYDKREVQHQQFPSNSSKGRDTHDGSLNHYALAYVARGTSFQCYPNERPHFRGVESLHFR